MHTSIKTPKTLDEYSIIKTLEDNIIFITFKNKLLDVSNMIGGKNQDRIEYSFLYGYDNLINQLCTKDELNDDRADELWKIFFDLYYKHQENYKYADLLQDLNSDYLIAEKLLHEWQSELMIYRQK